MDEGKVKEIIRESARKKLSGDSTGHDYHHVERVAKLGEYLAMQEGADMLVCCVCGYLHDYFRPDEKNRGVSHTGPEALAAIRDVVKRSGLDEQRIELVMECIAEHEYYPHAGHSTRPDTPESRILQDADRLDAIGAIGIARAFMYAGAHGALMYRPEHGKDNLGAGTAIGHFYDKLLLLKDEMHTEAARQMACRHQEVMGAYLSEFYDQWECKFDIAIPRR
jgi:uncharacterized protein